MRPSPYAIAQLVITVCHHAAALAEYDGSDREARTEEVVRDLLLARDQARSLADSLADLVADSGRTRTRVRDRDRARGLALDVGRAYDLCRGSVGFSAGAPELFPHHLDVRSSLSRAELNARYLADAFGRTGEPAGVTPGAQRLRRSPIRVLGLAARLLPPSNRSRYAEEYRCELHELARAGAGRVRQFRYAARQLARAPRLRVELRAPGRRKASR